MRIDKKLIYELLGTPKERRKKREGYAQSIATSGLPKPFDMLKYPFQINETVREIFLPLLKDYLDRNYPNLEYEEAIRHLKKEWDEARNRVIKRRIEESLKYDEERDKKIETELETICEVAIDQFNVEVYDKIYTKPQTIKIGKEKFDLMEIYVRFWSVDYHNGNTNAIAKELIRKWSNFTDYIRLKRGRRFQYTLVPKFERLKR